MEYIFNHLPFIYVYWACLLVVWSVVNSGMLFKIVASTCNSQTYTKRSTLMILMTILIGACVLSISVFIIPQITILFVEIALMLSLWYTVFLATISHLCIVEYLDPATF